MKRKVLMLSCAILFLLSCVSISIAQAQSPQQILNQYIADLQKNPNDYALREKIIKHVQTIKQEPAMPEEAKKYMVRGKAAFKGAKEANDFNDAAREFQKALLAAPWLAEGYYNLGVVQDKAGQYAVAMESLKLYVIAAPNATDVEKVKELIYEIEYRKEKAAKESSPAAIAVQEQKQFAELLKKMDGRRYKASPVPPYRNVVDVQGKMLVLGRLFKDDPNPYRFPGESCIYIEIQGRVFTCSYRHNELGLVENTYAISENGNRITGHIRYQGKESETVYLWP